MSEQVKTGHPKGLWVLFGTEMWERFNFYGMRAILSLFMVNALMLGESNASIIYGGFLALCYLTPLLGGFISDKYLGNRKCIMLGGTVMAIGQFLLFYSAVIYNSNLDFSKNIFWLGLLFPINYYYLLYIWLFIEFLVSFDTTNTIIYFNLISVPFIIKYILLRY
jgi:POT family proton-dependent oligopeptide transporter